MTVYGIPNCDTVKKSLDWLKKNKIDYEFHDYKKSGITKAKLEAWSKKRNDLAQANSGRAGKSNHSISSY